MAWYRDTQNHIVRAVLDTKKEVTGTLPFVVVSMLIGGLAFGVFTAFLVPESYTTKTQNVAGAISGVIGAAIVIALFLAWNLYRAPFRQRDEARALAGAGTGNSIDAPLPVSEVVTMHLNPFYMYGVRFDGLHRWDWDEKAFRTPPEGTKPIIQLTVFIAVSPKRKVEDLRVAIMGKRRAPIDGWEVEEIGPEVSRTMDLELPSDFAAGDHDIQILALIGGKWRAATELVRFPAPVI